MFEPIHFANYPKISIPQIFMDERGLISNIADGKLGDVAVITSAPRTIRANHYHNADWHFSYMVSGSMKYSWAPINNPSEQHFVIAQPGDLIYTPSLVAHKMEFLEDSCFIAISALSRSHLNYEADTVRLDTEHFHV